MDKLRIDKWLWAARFYKTRTLAVEEITKGRVQVNEQIAKPAREVKTGDMVMLRQGTVTRTVQVRGVSDKRGGAPIAQLLYEETPASIAQRAKQAEQRRVAGDPAIDREHGRPTKRERRDLDKVGWDSRWSASVD